MLFGGCYVTLHLACLSSFPLDIAQYQGTGELADPYVVGQLFRFLNLGPEVMTAIEEDDRCSLEGQKEPVLVPAFSEILKPSHSPWWKKVCAAARADRNESMTLFFWGSAKLCSTADLL